MLFSLGGDAPAGFALAAFSGEEPYSLSLGSADCEEPGEAAPCDVTADGAGSPG